MQVARSIADKIVGRICERLDLYNGDELATFDMTISNICANIFLRYPTLKPLNSHIQSFAERAMIEFLISQCYELFLAHFPKTRSTIVSFRHLMQCNDWYERDDLATELVKQIEKRLLHIGVNTNDILKSYAAAVESLTLFDASFVLMHRVCRPIRDYVRTRPDTMRTIIKYITVEKPGSMDNGNNKLTLILNDEQLLNLNDEYVIAVEDNAEDRWFDWRPDPVDADPRESRVYRESADVFNMLVSVYGSKDLFVKEYEKLLAERLFTFWEKHLSSESQYLAIMKKRFTQNELNNCEVMIRDIGDSAQLESEFAAKMHFPIRAIIISTIFWPEFSSINFKLHSLFRKPLKEFESFFNEKNRSRELHWYPNYQSSVELELEIDEVKMVLEVSLANAQVLLPFLEKERLNMDELCAECHMPETELKRCIEWWCERGILVRRNLDASMSESFSITEDGAQLQLLAKQIINQRANEAALVSDDEDEEEKEEVPLETQVEELEQFWPYTKNIICFQSTSEQPVTLARLAAVYKNIVSPGKPGPSLEAITMFMQQKVRQNLVIFDNGAYRPTAELRRM